MTVSVAPDDPHRPDVLALLREHLADMYATSPAESVHALDPSALTGAGTTFWTARDATGGDVLLGCVALREIAPGVGELKSMRTAGPSRGRGVGATMLAHVVAEATARGYHVLHLETGAEDYFAAARRLYERAGFRPCEPFGDYRPDRHSAFYELALPVASGS